MSVEVNRAFDHGASRYDLLVAMNPGYHQHLDRAARALAERIQQPRLLIDLGCGSGASTRALVRAFGDETPIRGVDASAGMLAQARAKAWPDAVRFEQGWAGSLAAADSPGADGILAAYLFRNVPADQRDVALRDTWSSLAPGGALVVLEYSVAGRPGPTALWNAVNRGVIMPLATAVGGNRALYRHLRRSVLDFDSVDAFAHRLHRAGFREVEVATVPGWQRGILHLFRGRR